MDPARSLFGAAALTAALALAACSSSSSAEAPQGSEERHEKAGTGTPETDGVNEEAAVETTTCDLPLVEDAYVGFSIGKPEGWTLNGVGGAVVVRQDAGGSELAFVYPVVPGDGFSIGTLFETMTGQLSETARAAGGDLSFTVTEEGDDAIVADVSGTFGGADVTGTAAVTPLEEQWVFAASWAPTDAFEAERATLREIVGCYDKTVGTPLSPHDGSYFSLSIPEGWQVDGETTNGIDISGPDRETGFSYGYVAGVAGAGDPASFRDQILQQVGLGDAGVVATQDLGQTQDQMGISWTSQASEFDASLQGRAVHGIITVTTADLGLGQFTGFYSIRLSASEVWDEYANVLALVHDSVRVTDVSEVAAGLRVPTASPSSDFSPSTMDTPETDENFEGWSEAMLGTETVQSPSTGDLYDVPLNSWDPTEGGYVRYLPDGSKELLEDY